MKRQPKPTLMKPISIRFWAEEATYLKRKARLNGWPIGLVVRMLVKSAMQQETSK